MSTALLNNVTVQDFDVRWNSFGLFGSCTGNSEVMFILYLCRVFLKLVGRDSSVGIATDYGLDSPGIESQRRRDFPPFQTGPGAHPASCTMGTGFFPGVKCGRGVLLTTHPLLVPWSWKSRAIPLPTPWATTGPVTGTLYLFYF